MREIPLVNGRGIALVDDEDYEQLAQFRWHIMRPSTTGAYAARNVGGRRGRTEYMHRQIIDAAGFVVDHVDGNGLNNQRSNLRVCSHAENSRNSRAHRRSASRFKGVARARKARWRAFVGLNGRYTHLGHFDTEEQAAQAYDAFAREHFGEFARLNYPLEGEQSALVGGSQGGSRIAS